MTSKEEKYEEWRRYFFEVDKEMYEYFTQDLERLEALNKVWHDNEPMESVDINANHLQELYNYINKLQQENQILNMSVIDTYDSANDMIFELQEIGSNLKQENEKLKKAIEIIKTLPNCDICDANWHKGCMCLQRKIKEVLG